MELEPTTVIQSSEQLVDKIQYTLKRVQLNFLQQNIRRKNKQTKTEN
jgi:hypothetical protein